MSEGTDARVIERLEGAAQREESLRKRLRETTLLLGQLFEANDGGADLTGILAGEVHREWWKANREWYAQMSRHAMRTSAEADRKRIARAALKKLTVREREALRLPSGKRV